MEETYTTVARSIVRDAIRSVIFVDDELAMPFDEMATQDQRDLSSGMYKSFTTNDSGLDFYHFQSAVDWEPKKEYLFKGRDLLVIDWQLDSDPAEHRTTLKILQEAVNRPSLHFVCIYTSTELAGFEDILYQIGTYFSVANTAKAEETLSTLQGLFDDEDHRDESLGQDFRNRCKELILYSERKDDLVKDTRAILVKALTSQNYGKARNTFINAYGSESEAFQAIGAVLNEVLTGEGDKACDVAVHANERFVKVNHTLILLMNKTQVQPMALYEKFSEAVIKSSKNFLTLLGLEMRNLYRSGSSFIGKDIDSINELAFFYHQRQSHPPEAFTEFLSELWKNQSFTFMYDRSMQPKLITRLPDYIAQKELGGAINAYSTSPDGKQGMGRLNYYYNILKTNRVTADKIRFGDILRLLTPENQPTESYLLCITAHCDCLHSDKIQNMFYFVKGAKHNLAAALSEGDTGHYSYIIDAGQVETISWSDKPFTLYISPEKNNIENIISVTLADKPFSLSYHSTIKENYAQRMANRAASYPLRVGIYFADFKPSGTGLSKSTSVDTHDSYVI